MPEHPFVVRSHDPSKVSAPPPVVSHAATASISELGPDQLSIPSLGTSAPLFPEVIDNFSLEIPGNVRHVGIWTGGGQVDGSTGTVLLAGHINWYDQGNGALYDLANIRPGALIYVTDSTGRVTTWSAVSLQAYPKSDLPQGIFAPTGPRSLVLVTCGGAFDPATGHYADNVVVTAAPVTSPAGMVSS